MSSNFNRSGAYPAALVTVFSGLLVINLIRETLAPLVTVDPGAAIGVKLGAVAAAALSLKFLAALIAPVIYLMAFWSAVGLYFNLSTEKAFSDMIVRGVSHIGGWLLLAGVVSCLIVPMLNAWAAGDVRTAPINLNTANVAVAMVGVTMQLIATKGRRLRMAFEQFV